MMKKAGKICTMLLCVAMMMVMAACGAKPADNGGQSGEWKEMENAIQDLQNDLKDVQDQVKDDLEDAKTDVKDAMKEVETELNKAENEIKEDLQMEDAQIDETTPTAAPTQEPEMTAAPTQKPEVTATPEPEEELVDGMRPEFKAAMDSYEAFYDEYCDFMEKYYKNPSDLSLLTEYGQMLAKAADMNAKFAEWEDGDLNAAELQYYTEVNNRVLKRIIEVAG